MKRVLVFACFLLLALAGAPPLHASSITIEEVTSPRGLKAWLVRDPRAPVVTLRFSFHGGVEQDPEDRQGLSELAAGLLTEGAGPYDAAAFQKRLADRSIELTIGAGRDRVQGSLRTLRAHKDAAFGLLRLALASPRFDDAAIARRRARQEAQRRFLLGDADWQARYALFAALFGDHPYAQRRLGTATTLAAITRDDLRRFARNRLARDTLVVAAAGALTPAELGAALDRAFGDLPPHAKLAPLTDKNDLEEPGARILVPREGTQTEIRFALPMLRRNDPDWYAAEILDYTLGGGGFSSRLMKEIRDREGLTYGVGTSLSAMDHASILFGQMATDNARTGEAWARAERVFGAFHDEGPTAAEVAAAKDYLTGALPLGLTSTSSIAAMLLHMQEEGLGRDYLDRYPERIRQVTDADLRRVLRRWFDPSALRAVFVGQPEGIAASAQRAAQTE